MLNLILIGLLQPVSVPLRGNGCETISQLIDTMLKYFFSLFPSPCGVMGVKPRFGYDHFGYLNANVSVPLRGNGCETTLRLKQAKTLKICFRPLAG